MTNEQIQDVQDGAAALLAVVESEFRKRIVYLHRAEFLSNALKQRLLAMQAIELTTPADFFSSTCTTPRTR